MGGKDQTYVNELLILDPFATDTHTPLELTWPGTNSAQFQAAAPIVLPLSSIAAMWSLIFKTKLEETRPFIN